MCTFDQIQEKNVYETVSSTEQSGSKEDYMEMPNFKCVGSSEEQTEESRKFGAEDKINSKGKKKTI